MDSRALAHYIVCCELVLLSATGALFAYAYMAATAHRYADVVWLPIVAIVAVHYLCLFLFFYGDVLPAMAGISRGHLALLLPAILVKVCLIAVGAGACVVLLATDWLWQSADAPLTFALASSVTALHAAIFVFEGDRAWRMLRSQRTADMRAAVRAQCDTGQRRANAEQATQTASVTPLDAAQLQPQETAGAHTTATNGQTGTVANKDDCIVEEVLHDP